MTRILILLLCAFPMAAETGRYVARIDVRSGNIPANIIRSQSVLAEGRAYTDADLEIALARLRRLPFVYDARYAFEGETLILTVDDTRRLFFNAQLDSARFVGDSAGLANLGGGGRLFFRPGGVLQLSGGAQLAEGGNGSVLRAEYAHYGIAGSRAFAMMSVERMSIQDAQPDPTWRLTAGYPLTLRTTLTASAIRDGFSRSSTFRQLPRPIEFSTSRQIYELRWRYDTTDDPYFALRGATFAAAPRWIHQERFSENFLGTTIFPTEREGSTASAIADATLYLPVLRQSAFFTTLVAEHESGDFEERRNGGAPFALALDSSTVVLSAAWAHNFFTRGGAAAPRQRIEIGGGIRRQKFDDSRFGDGPWIEDRHVTLGYSVRHPAATVRLNLAYVYE